ncbi:GNAT family N-acetyltransferase [Corynebacterium mayonis]|uniref:GNAT family N-acetyltransferase n=1 Tax=Corynebacterium mayonis TaxID=3062461 RepID=UPI003140388E
MSTEATGVSAASWEADVILNDGSIATLRAIEERDREDVEKFFSRVSEHSKYLRFFGSHPRLTDEDWARWSNTGSYDKVTLAMLQRGEIIAVAGYYLVPQLLPARVGDVSFLVQDDHHGKGAANILLEHLAEIGREGGVERFVAEMLTQNRTMVQVFLRAGYTVSPELADGYITVDFLIAPNATSREVMHRRELRAEANSIRGLVTPRSVALIGAPHVPALIDAHRATSPAEITEPVDLVVAEYDHAEVQAVLRAAALARARAVVIMSRGTNPGIEADEATAIIAAARDLGLRVLGPASLGVLNTAHGLNTTPAAAVRPGTTGLFTQSAGVAALTLSHAIDRGCGLSTFVASGAFADVTANDVMQFWSDDDSTKICLLSLDKAGNPRKFFRILRRLALQKHVVVFFPSRALAGGDPVALDMVIGNSGAMVVNKRDTMFDIAQVLARQPVPRGPRVRVVSNSAGLTDQMEAAARRFGLDPTSTTVFGPPEVELAREVNAALEDENVEAVLCAVVDIGADFADLVYNQLAALAAEEAVSYSTPLVASFVGFNLPDYRRREGAETLGQLPVVETYADALEALGAIVSNERRRAHARPTPEDVIGVGDEARARKVISDILTDCPEGRWANDEETAAILSAYGIDSVPWVPVASLDEALAAGADLGWDVVLKCLNPQVRGRAELPTIIRNVGSEAAMQRAWQTISTLAGELGLGDDPAVLSPVVQRTVAPGASLSARAVEDPVLGPLISVGMSGLPSELLGDVTWGAPPLRRRDAAAMLAELRAAELLTGYRGTTATDTEELERILVQLARLNDDFAAVAEVELGPLIATASLTSVVGARLRVAPAGDERDPLARRLAL